MDQADGSGRDGAATPANRGRGSEGGHTHLSEGSGADEGATRTQSGKGRLIGVVIALVLLLAVVGFLTWKIAFEEALEPGVPPAVTVTNPAPTTEVTPIQKEAVSPFYDLLPETVLQFALTESAADESRELAQALEAFTLTYGDGSGGEITVDASQWPSVENAESGLKTLESQEEKDDAGAELIEGPVEHAGAEVGSFMIRAGTEQGTAVWTNGTGLFRASGPAEEIEDFYKAFPL